MAGTDSTPSAMGHGETVLERVLLAIIEAHPSPEMESRQVDRLQEAMAMLLGTSQVHSAAIDKALIFMVRERQRDICNADMSALAIGSDVVPLAARSMSELAEIAARSVLGLACPNEVRATAGLLCGDYRRRAARHVVEYDPTVEAMQDEGVRRILDELAEWDVPSVSPK